MVCADEYGFDDHLIPFFLERFCYGSNVAQVLRIAVVQHFRAGALLDLNQPLCFQQRDCLADGRSRRFEHSKSTCAH